MAKRLNITGVEITDYGKKAGVGYAILKAPALQGVGTDYDSIFDALSIKEDFETYIPKCNIDGDLLVSTFEAVPVEENLHQFGLTGPTGIINCQLFKFSCVRLELKGSQGVGKRYEFHFELAFNDPLGLAKLEALENGAPKRPLNIYASFSRQAQQQKLPGVGDDGDRIDLSTPLRPTPESRQRILGAEDDEPAQGTEPPAPIYADTLKDRKEQSARRRQMASGAADDGAEEIVEDEPVVN